MNKQKAMSRLRAKSHLDENITYQLRDKDGNIKKLFKVNKLGQAIFRKMSKLVANPIEVILDKKGAVVSSHVKTGVMNHLAAYGLRIPFLTGQWVNELHVANLITNAGMAGVASRINGSGAEAAFTYIAIGTGTTAAVVANTTLETEITTGGGARAAATASRTTTDVTDDTATLVKTFALTATFAITEAGALNAASAGVLLNRQVFTAVNVINGDSLQITINIDVD